MLSYVRSEGFEYAIESLHPLNVGLIPVDWLGVGTGEGRGTGTDFSLYS